MTDQMHLYIGRTLIDCTKTGSVTSDNSKLRNQHRNWETLIQVLGLRAQLITLTTPSISDINSADLQFGTNFEGKQRVWTFEFGVEHEAIFADGENPVGTLENDFVNVPIILGLDETAAINAAIFCPFGPDKNIYFEEVEANESTIRRVKIV